MDELVKFKHLTQIQIECFHLSVVYSLLCPIKVDLLI